jgi:TonB family protein
MSDGRGEYGQNVNKERYRQTGIHGKPFANLHREMYSAREIAKAAGVPEGRVRAALGRQTSFLSHAEAVALGRRLITGDRRSVAADRGLFSIFEGPAEKHSATVPFAVSSTLHAGIVAAAILILTLSPAPVATSLQNEPTPNDPMRLVFLNTSGPGGGGGGGGLMQKAPPPKALREGRKKISSPLPQRQPPPKMEPVEKPPEPKPAPPLAAETLPVVVAPIVTAPADNRDRAGILQQARVEAESRGPGQGGGVGTGKGTGIGEGDGSGIGPGSGGGTGGGPFRPGSGITPPRVLREVKADYTDEARRAGITGDVVLEIVVRRDGSVTDVKLLKGLSGGLNDRAIQAVRQWRFAPATRQGTPVDVIVEVAVEFKLR